MLRGRICLLGLLVVLCFGSIALASQEITMTGSSTVHPIAQPTAEAFMDLHPDVNVTVRGGGSGTGITALIDGITDIANSSRWIRLSEVETALSNGIYPVPHRVAMDGIAVIVHPSNPVDSLTLDQIKDIYTGKVKNWSELGGANLPIVVMSRESSSGTYEVWGEIALQGERLAPTALLRASSGALAQDVAETRGAIGYVGLGYLNDSLKALAVNGVLPSNSTVVSGAYPVARPLFMFTDGWPEGITSQYINFVLSAEGQAIVGAQGFVPLF